MRPEVIIHTQVSLDGCIRGFEDTGLYYRVAAGFGADTVLFGADTVLAAAEQWRLTEKESDFHKPALSPEDTRPLAVVADSRGRLRCLHFFRNFEYIRDVVVLVSHSTPESYLDYLKEREYDFIVAGDDHVDYRSAFEELYSRFQCRRIRTDSGGRLTNILLEQGLADRLSLVVSPCLVGDAALSTFRTLSLPTPVKLELQSVEHTDDGAVHLVYRLA